MASAEEMLEDKRLLRGNDVLLPKYVISSGRGESQSDAHLSMARLYFRDMNEVLEAIKSDGSDYAFSPIGDKPATYIGFILQQVTEQRTEKVQTIPLAGDSFHSTFFGQMPRQYVFQGMLFNSKNARWRESFDRLYENYLRGYKAAGEGRPVQIIYDSKIVSGWITNVSQTISATNEMLVPFNMTIQVLRDTSLTPVEQINGTVEDYSLEYKGPELGVTDTRVVLGPDDYVRKASIALPMRASTSTSSVAGRCRVIELKKARYGVDKEVRAPQGPVASRSPVTSTCDMAEALHYHLREKEKATAKIADIQPTSKKKKAQRKALIRKKNKHEEHLRRLQGWAEKKAEGTERVAQIAGGSASDLIKRARAGQVTSSSLKDKLKAIKKK